ncbi:MAG: aspartyl/glutamyl-tRNA amidotransferase subunit A [Candidatus Doudnabacteria bacterium RIFCSPHIGHO2_01_FULL_46_14]|uniref:Glutamyl-tRNA(Gln) amidotransferase subunit A n=1 Tax=Candidatus Doudnabacteria bacterium RIFCSPHIGHO2_01_FULL_46_14 TaxID=1817824 RepID=A0A1F5NN47_9BACT|nr:MAG: aspartyl/glutamyl-tRNA amidotransferase subunit A [Candidatus Doudnabacteria bacterium RIFCSPHIGHO2_01_FULL_46_14]
MDFHLATIKELRQGLDSKRFSSAELTKYYLDRIKKFNKDLNAFITLTEDLALEQARAADKRIAAGSQEMLTGIPYAAKDLFCTRGVRTTAASKILENFVPPYDSTVVARLRAAGAVLVGKTNLDQFAHGSSTETSYYGPVHNPWDLERNPGGSSGGSAAAVSAGLVPFALATETGGSIRQPASLCGISGWKPTYGRVSRYGVIAMSSSMDTMGTVARSAEDLAITAEAISGFDPKDGTSGKLPVKAWSKNLTRSMKGLRIGVPQEYFVPGIEKDVKEKVSMAIEEIRKLGPKIIEVSLPMTSYGSMVYAIVTPSEISSNLSRYDSIRFGHTTDKANDLYELYAKSRAEGFGDEAKRRIMTGAYALSAGYRDAYYTKAQKVRRLLVNEFHEMFKKVDILLCPSTPNVALKIGKAADDPLFGYIADQLNIPASLAGLAAMGVPCGLGKPDDGAAVSLPIGMQILGPQWGEELVFQVGYAYQQITDWHKQKPVGF